MTFMIFVRNTAHLAKLNIDWSVTVPLILATLT